MLFVINELNEIFYFVKHNYNIAFIFHMYSPKREFQINKNGEVNCCLINNQPRQSKKSHKPVSDTLYDQKKILLTKISLKNTLRAQR